MRITQEADYALRVILFLSKLGFDNKIEAKSISESEGIPLRFLLKLLRKLKQSGIVQSYRGVHGGYSLGKKPREITLKDVIESIDGPICMNRCLYDPNACNIGRTSECEIHHAMAKIQTLLSKELENVNFEQLISK